MISFLSSELLSSGIVYDSSIFNLFDNKSMDFSAALIFVFSISCLFLVSNCSEIKLLYCSCQFCNALLALTFSLFNFSNLSVIAESCFCLFIIDSSIVLLLSFSSEYLFFRFSIYWITSSIVFNLDDSVCSLCSISFSHLAISLPM